MEDNIKIILERKGVGFFAHDDKLQSSIKGRKRDQVTVRFSNRTLSQSCVWSVVSQCHYNPKSCQVFIKL